MNINVIKSVWRRLPKPAPRPNKYQFLTPVESARLALKRHIESLPDWDMDHIRWCMRYLDRPVSQEAGSLFSSECDSLFEH